MYKIQERLSDGKWHDTGWTAGTQTAAQDKAWAWSGENWNRPTRYIVDLSDFPHAAAAQSRLDAGKAFTPCYRVMVAVSPQSRRMVDIDAFREELAAPPGKETIDFVDAWGVPTNSAKRMVAIGGPEGVTQFDEDWAAHADAVELDRQSFMDKTRGM